MLPDAHGVIVTDDGALIMFSLQGRTFFEHDTGKQILTTIFEAEDQRYRWLNTTMCILEGVISAERASMHARLRLCPRAALGCLTEICHYLGGKRTDKRGTQDELASVVLPKPKLH